MTVWLAMRVVGQVSGRIPVMLCGASLAVYPPLLNLTRQLITETWFILFLFLAERAVSLVTLLSPCPFWEGVGGERRGLRTKLIFNLSDGCVFALAIWALLRLKQMRWRVEIWMILAPVFGLTLLYGLLFSQPRYRWPFMPFLICCVAIVWGCRRSSDHAPEKLGAGAVRPDETLTVQQR